MEKSILEYKAEAWWQLFMLRRYGFDHLRRHWPNFLLDYVWELPDGQQMMAAEDFSFFDIDSREVVVLQGASARAVEPSDAWRAVAWEYERFFAPLSLPPLIWEELSALDTDERRISADLLNRLLHAGQGAYEDVDWDRVSLKNLSSINPLPAWSLGFAAAMKTGRYRDWCKAEKAARSYLISLSRTSCRCYGARNAAACVATSMIVADQCPEAYLYFLDVWYRIIDVMEVKNDS